MFVCSQCGLPGKGKEVPLKIRLADNSIRFFHFKCVDSFVDEREEWRAFEAKKRSKK